MTRRTINPAGGRVVTAALLGAGFLLGLSTATYADVAPPPEPKPRIEVPPRPEEPKCELVFGWKLREDGPPIPFVELRCQ